MPDRLRVGVLASQGDFAAHATMLRELGADAVEVRTAQQLAGLDALVIPGGESTTITKAIVRDGLEEAIRGHAGAGKPILGTCAGMIVCDREHLGLIDAVARRNAFGRQIASFEADWWSRAWGRSRCGRCSSAPPGSRAPATAWRCWRRSTAIRSWSGMARSLPAHFIPS